MAADPAIKGMMTTTVDIAEPSAAGSVSGGITTWGTPVSVEAYIQPHHYTKKTSDGERLVPGHLIFTETKITREHKVWLPEEDSATDAGHRPVSVEDVRTAHDGDEVSHYEVML